MVALKELMACVLLFIAIFCIVTGVGFTSILPVVTDYKQLYYRSACFGTAYICILYALSTWFYNSNFMHPRQHLRYMMFVQLIVLGIVHCYLGGMVMQDYAKDGKLANMTNLEELIDDDEYRQLALLHTLSVAIAIFLFVAAIFMAFLAIKKILKHKKRAKTQQN